MQFVKAIVIILISSNDMDDEFNELEVTKQRTFVDHFKIFPIPAFAWRG
jgi:hypothetical protein